MPNLNAALLYPGCGLWEFTNLSVGRGTRLPFEMVGAPYIDPDLLARELRSSQLSGLQFVPVRFTPSTSKFADETCGGVRILIKDRTVCRPLALGLALARILRRHYPAEWDRSYLNRLLCHPPTASAIVEQAAPERIMAGWGGGGGPLRDPSEGVSPLRLEHFKLKCSRCSEEILPTARRCEGADRDQ